MAYVTIHESGSGADKVKVDSYWNGAAYNISFGEAGSPMQNIFFQGEDALELRYVFEDIDEATPDREAWLEAVDPYLV